MDDNNPLNITPTAEPLEETESITPESEASQEGDENQPIPDEINLLPLREVVIFPVVVAPLGVGRENSIKLVNESMVGGNRLIAVSCMKDPGIENPTLDDVYKIGAIIAIRMMAQVPEGIRLIVQGVQRFEILEAVQTSPYLRVKIRPIAEPVIAESEHLEIEALRRSIGEQFKRIVALSSDLPDEMGNLPDNVLEAGVLTDLIAAQMPRLSFQERQEILETIELQPRMTRLMVLLAREVQLLELGNRLQSEVANELGKTQREYYLREQVRQIQKELGEKDDFRNEIQELEDKFKAKDMPEEARDKTEKEIRKLKMMSPMSAEATVVRNYVDWMLALPWNEVSKEEIDMGIALLDQLMTRVMKK